MDYSQNAAHRSLRLRGVAWRPRDCAGEVVSDFGTGAAAGLPLFSTSPGRMRRTDTTFQPVSIPSRRNLTRMSRNRLGGSPSEARRSVAVAVTSARS